MSFTELKADASGVITAVAAEPGEVVQAGRTIVQVARDGGRDAVFDVPASILRTAPGDTEVTVSLADDPRVRRPEASAKWPRKQTPSRETSRSG